ncbi:hypothetical protein SFUMM280S_06263 [Streptomyces fumanus]
MTGSSGAVCETAQLAWNSWNRRGAGSRPDGVTPVTGGPTGMYPSPSGSSPEGTAAAVMVCPAGPSPVDRPVAAVIVPTPNTMVTRAMQTSNAEKALDRRSMAASRWHSEGEERRRRRAGRAEQRRALFQGA